MDGYRNPQIPYVSPKPPKPPGGSGHGHGHGRGGLPNFFPSTTIGQQAINQLLAQARTQVQKNYSASPLPSQQTYLQPYVDRRSSNDALAAQAATYLQNSRDYAQNLAGAFTSAATQALAANAAAPGGSGLPGAVPAPTTSVIPMNMVGSSWTNYLNALVPAQATRAQEANQQVNSAEDKALADYRAAQTKRTSDMQDAVTTLYKSNLDTLQKQKDDSYRNALTLYALLGKEKYQKMLLKQNRDEFNANLDFKRGQQSDLNDYRQATLDQKRHAAKAKTGVDLLDFDKVAYVTTADTPKGKLRLGPLGQIGGYYQVTPYLYAADDPNNPTPGTPIADTPRKPQFVPYGQVPPVTNKHQLVIRTGIKYAPKGTVATSRKITAASWDAGLHRLQAKYPGKITADFIKKYLPARPAA